MRCTVAIGSHAAAGVQRKGNGLTMDDVIVAWTALIVAVLIVAGYEWSTWQRSRTAPLRTARSAHREMRRAWLAAISAQPGTEILAVQTLRNSLMSATITSSTAALALMGSVSLAALHAGSGPDALRLDLLTPQLALRLLLLTSLFASLVCSAMAMRSYSHAGYAVAMPVGSEARRRYARLAEDHLGKAGLLYSWSLRCLMYVAPILAGLIHPALAPLGSLALAGALALFDRVGADA